ncbi:hypothetical protein HYPSUDRAFT_202044 [Hypholoma sublateritium FD-334 SS-4]|uniref:CxC2-like cysteine cluster KDZ transposase-associated domain-containing protein n=1 Tax=Hypholoma sublateritium (strain FD-334 SS-4) TaxID=945553 RepID=A0A0D2L6W5_HYPSF|nr:hypothetical protein HYPSUDRAFT_202044 [Hypholoma sublateritium FD-334 SS-4]
MKAGGTLQGMIDAQIASREALESPGEALESPGCLIRRHKLNPFHTVERWDGSYFTKTTLKEVGLVIHLNHSGMRCPMPAACDERLRVVHTTGVHEVSLSYSTQQKVRTCVTFALLKLLHLFSLMGKVSVYDMYRSIERLTNNTGLHMPRSRYRPTMRCLTQWRHLKALKRAGRGHDAEGADGTADGDLAILCPSCPRPGINLPEGWQDVPQEKQLKNNLVSNASTDPGLWNGAAYMTPRSSYENYVLSQADSEDISTCVGFQALAKATTQSTRGLRYTGVAAAVCGRSEMVLPNSVGNLQKGESLVDTWEQMCVAWDLDGFPKSAPNPFHTADTSISEDEVQEQLGRDEAAVQKASRNVALHSTSATSFLVLGLELEESQRRLKIFAAEQSHIPKSLQTTALRDQRKILTDKVKNWQTVQAVYMPGLLQIQTNCGANPIALWSSNPNPEDVELWLPSNLPADQRRAVCVEGLPYMELQLRTAQCSSSLQGLRQTLRIKTRLVYFKNKNVRGQREGTRSRAIIDRIHKRAIHFVQKYRAARRAKYNLEGPGDWEDVYCELRNEDVRGYASGKAKKNPNRRGIWEDGHAPPSPEPAGVFDNQESEESDLDLNDGTEAGPPPRKKRKKGTGETRKELSWIWRTVPLFVDGNDNDDILRAEWSRSRARVHRATEEVALLREEMRRVLEFIKWSAMQWDFRATISPDDASLELKEGISALDINEHDSDDPASDDDGAEDITISE